jgi:uncharacterized protein (DUF433 family)
LVRLIRALILTLETAGQGIDVMNTQTIEIGSLITRTPGIKGGKAHVAGTAVTIRTIAKWYKLGLSPEEIQAEISHLTLAQVYAALAYYHANLDEMESEIVNEEEESNRIEAEHLRVTSGVP